MSPLALVRFALQAFCLGILCFFAALFLMIVVVDPVSGRALILLWLVVLLLLLGPAFVLGVTCSSAVRACVFEGPAVFLFVGWLVAAEAFFCSCYDFFLCL